MHTNPSPIQGFTLVELVMVIVLIGIISSLGVGLFASRSNFSPLLISQQITAAALLAQQRALANNDGNPVRMQVSQSVSQVTVTLSQGGAAVTEPFEADRDNVNVTANGAAVGGGFTLDFDANGRTGSNTQFAVVGDSTHNLCISAMGFAYDGLCQP